MTWRHAKRSDATVRPAEPARTKPLARSSELVIEDVAGELLVYDQRVHRAHCLSVVAARVWGRCDGRSSLQALAAELAIDAETVRRALEELELCDLLETQAQPASGSTRRELTVKVAKLGAAVASVPLIVSVSAPAAAAAATLAFCNSACPAPCSSGNCGSCCDDAFAGCGCCNCKGDKFCTPLGPTTQSETCIALHGGPDNVNGCNITCEGGVKA